LSFSAIQFVRRIRTRFRRGHQPKRMAAGLATGAVLGAILIGCASGSVDSFSAITPPPSCIVLAGNEASPGPTDSIPSVRDRSLIRTLGLTHSLDPARAPVPTNPDEAMIFGLVYEPLVRMDCTGRLHPGLAASWESRDDGRRWTLTLRSDARFADGTDLTARDVAESWRRTEEAGRSPWGSSGASDRPLSVDVLGSRRVELTFADARSRLPPVLTTSGLAVAGPSASGAGPSVGTGPYRWSEIPDRAPGLGVSRPSDPEPVAAPEAASVDIALEPTGPYSGVEGLPILGLRIEPGEDPRNLLGAGVDVLVTDDPETLEYARLRSDLVYRPLPWSRRYLLITRTAGIAPPDSFLGELARDVVRAEARPAPGMACQIGDRSGPGLPTSDPFRADSASRTGRSSGGPSSRQRIGYDGNDRSARALAERIVALATAPAGSSGSRPATVLRMLGMDEVPSGLVAAPGSGPLEPDEIARVTSVPRRPDAACRIEGDRVVSRNGPDRTETTQTTIPLIETRRSLIARTPTVPMAVDGTGTPYFPRTGAMEGDRR